MERAPEPEISRRAGPSGTFAALAAALAACLGLCLALVPRVVNGDGLGYLKAAPTGIYYPGHLAYLPLLRLLAAWRGGPLPSVPAVSLALLRPARALSMVAALVAVAALHRAALWLHQGREEAGRAAFFAAAGLAVSFGALQVGADVESYAPALAALGSAFACAARRATGGGAIWTAATAAAVALATLLHVENALLALPMALLCARAPAGRAPRLVDGAAVLVGSGGLVLASYLAVFAARQDTPSSALRFFLGAGHGYTHPLHLSTPLIALYGMAKTLVYAPYPHQASWARVIGQSLAGLAGLGTLAWLARRPGRAKLLDGGVGPAWLLPYGLVGVGFFASDNERWLFLLPPAWLLAGAGAATSARAGRVGATLLGALVALDLALGVPLARESAIRERADRLAPLVGAGDLVISPGHSWDEYIGFYQAIAIDRFPMIYFCGLLGGGEAMSRELSHRVVDARARRARIFFARLDEPAGSDGWKELALFGITPDNVDLLLPPGRRTPVTSGLVRLDPTGTP